MAQALPSECLTSDASSASSPVDDHRSCCVVGSTSEPATEVEGLTDTQFRRAFIGMRESGEMCDVTIIVEDTEILAHKLILSGCSPYFRGMFRDGNFDESRKNRIHIDPNGDLAIRASAIEQLITYIYTGHISISQRNAMDLLRAADLLELMKIKQDSLCVIESLINFESYIEIRDTGRVYNCGRLIQAVDSFIRNNFREFTLTQAFVDLKEEELTDYLAHPHLRTDTEETVFEAVVIWCKTNERPDAFQRVADNVRFEYLSINYLLRCLTDEEMIRDNQNLSTYLLKKMQSISAPHLCSRPRFSTQMLIAIPDRSTYFFLITFYGDHIEFTKREIPPWVFESEDGDFGHFNFSACRMRNLVHVTGGITVNGSQPFQSDKAFYYQPLKDEWYPSIELSGNLFQFGMGSIDGRLYVVGGVAAPTNEPSCIVECLDLEACLSRSDQSMNSSMWQRVGPLNYQRSRTVVVTVKDKLFSIGGMLDGGYTSMVEMYDPHSDIWSEMEPMTQARCIPGVAVHGKFIYVVGGLGDNLLGPPGALKTVECYDTEDDTWNAMHDMYFARTAPAVAVVNGKLFVFGGSGGTSPLVSPGPERTIECFDFERNEWFVLQSKMPGRSNSSYAAAFFDGSDII